MRPRGSVDLTRGPIGGHLLRLAAPIALGMLFQTLYYLVDLYFVAQLGDYAIAGVSAAGNLTYIVIALTQVLGVGTGTLVAQALGRGDMPDAVRVFNQSLGIALLLSVVLLVGGYALVESYMAAFGADRASIAAGTQYLRWYLPGLGMQFMLVALGSALRGSGIVKPAMLVQLMTVVVNALLAPILIVGWGTGYALGVAGAGLASSIAITFGVVLMWRFFHRMGTELRVDARMLKPHAHTWRRVFGIGLPAGGEFLLMFLYTAFVYRLIRPFGVDAQAAFGIGGRVMQSMFLPVMAVAFATAPLAAQNVGAGHAQRVRETFYSAAWIGSGLMFVLTLLCQWQAATLIGGFSTDVRVIAIGAGFLQIISWNFVSAGLAMTCSGLFQAIGNTLPAMLSSAVRLLLFVVPAIWLARQPGFELQDLWMLSVATGLVQAVLSLWLLRTEFERRLPALQSGPR